MRRRSHDPAGPGRRRRPTSRRELGTIGWLAVVGVAGLGSLATAMVGIAAATPRHDATPGVRLAVATSSTTGATTTTTAAPPAPVTIATSTTSTTTPPAPVTRPVPPPPAGTCAEALAYLAAHQAPGFVDTCGPGTAFGHYGIACWNRSYCPDDQKIIHIACPLPFVYMNEAHNSWMLVGARSGVDPYGQGSPSEQAYCNRFR